MAQVKCVFVVCSTCRAEVDRLEYTDENASTAVQTVMTALNVDQVAATDLVKKSNPGAELTSRDNTLALARNIVELAVPDREATTYLCPAGHDGGLQVTEDLPTPTVTVTIQKVGA